MHYVVHYSEIGIKGDNRPVFEQRLVDNIRQALRPAATRVRREFGRLVIALDEGQAGADPRRIEERLARVPGVSHFAAVTPVARELPAITEAALRLARADPGTSFRVRAQRSDKRFSTTSVEINRQVGAAVVAATGKRVDLERAELTLGIEITAHDALVYARRQEGVGGLPVGIAGTVVALLSGGIDSPVAAFRLIRRGAPAVLLHFHNYSRDQERVRDKLLDLARILTRYQLRSRLWLVPFADIQAALVAAVPAPARMIAYRRVMLRLGETVLEREAAGAFVSGDALGQVASQTLDNLAAIYAATRYPILTPLIGDDKDDIVAAARRIGTYEVSVRPYQDCCSFLVARHPDTRTDLAALERAEARIPLAALGKQALDEAEIHEITAPD